MFVINGQKCFISGGGISEVYLVMCLTGEKEKSYILVPKNTPGLSFGKPEQKMGWKSSPTAVVNFDNCRVPVTNLIGKRGEGFIVAMKPLDTGRINIASTSLGGAAFCLEKA
jgi:alkylation response protein AidB-like acyl-CoA dehydrogenase